MAALQEQRHIYYDKDLQIEAYNLSGIVQKFPVHFHEFQAKPDRFSENSRIRWIVSPRLFLYHKNDLSPL